MVHKSCSSFQGIKIMWHNWRTFLARTYSNCFSWFDNIPVKNQANLCFETLKVVNDNFSTSRKTAPKHRFFGFTLQEGSEWHIYKKVCDLNGLKKNNISQSFWNCFHVHCKSWAVLLVYAHLILGQLIKNWYLKIIYQFLPPVYC